MEIFIHAFRYYKQVIRNPFFGRKINYYENIYYIPCIFTIINNVIKRDGIEGSMIVTQVSVTK